VTSNGISSIPSFVKFGQMVKRLKVGVTPADSIHKSTLFFLREESRLTSKNIRKSNPIFFVVAFHPLHMPIVLPNVYTA
jgi:hypothetical protein